MDNLKGKFCPMCGTPVGTGVPNCPACGENLLPSRLPFGQRAHRANWREIAGVLAAVPVFVVGIGMLLWLVWKCISFMMFGGAISELSALLLATVLPFLLGWELLFGRKGDS